MKKLYLFLSIAVVTFLSSCGSVELLRFEQLKPAEISFPDELKNVAIVNNMPKEEHGKLAYLRNTAKEFEGDGASFMQGLADVLAEGNYFNKVVVCDSLLYVLEEDDAPQYHVLKAPQVRQLLGDLDSDMIISVDRLYVRTGIGQVWDNYYGMPFDAVNASYAALVHLYVPTRDKAFMQVTDRDTLQFELDLTLSDAIIAKETSEYAGMRIANKLVPYWSEVQRIYYDGGLAEFRDAGVALRENDLEEAGRLWSKLYEKKKGKNKMHAAFNMALYCEMTDQMDKAVEWLDKAKALVGETNVGDKNTITFYQAALQNRIQELNKLKMQMSRFKGRE